MDSLSHLLALVRMQVQLDVRCRLSGTYAIPHEPLPTGEAPFHLVLAGSCRLQTGRKHVLLQPGDFLLLPHGDAHDVVSARVQRAAAPKKVRSLVATATVLPIKSNTRASDEADLDLFCGRFLCAGGAGSILLQSLPSMMHVNLADPTSNSLHALVGLLRHEATHPRPGALAIVNALGQAILTQALRAHGEEMTASPNLLAPITDPRLGPSVQALLKDPARDWTIATLGATVAMSRATYARRFHDAAGMSVGEFLLRVRMIHACDWLKHGNLPLIEIAQRVGYQSETAFRNAFCTLIGETPARWRRRQRRHVPT